MVWPSVQRQSEWLPACQASGIGIGSVAATDMGMSVAESLKATAAGVLNTSAQLGTAIGTSVTLLVAMAFEARTPRGCSSTTYAALAAHHRGRSGASSTERAGA